MEQIRHFIPSLHRKWSQSAGIEGILKILLIFFSFVHVNQWKNTTLKPMMGSPAVKFLSTVHGKLNSLAMMNLKILFTFMLRVALEKNIVVFIALAHALASICMHAQTSIIFDNTCKLDINLKIINYFN
jgi:hypothetical protein